MERLRKSYLSALEDNHCEWNGQPGIFAKIDWFTAVFKNCSVADVLNAIELEKFDTVDFEKVFADRLLTSVGAVPEVLFNFNGVVIQLRYESVLYELGLNELTEEDYNDLFYLPFQYIRMDISGKGLDYLRSIGIDVDTVLRQEFKLTTGEYHPTRCDVAFDLVDYCGDFVTECRKLCAANQDPVTHRVPAQSKGGIKWSDRGGDQNTLYLGSVGSDRLLRIYDKKLQFVQANKWQSDSPFKHGDHLPDTWIRIELQVRRPSECGKVLYTSGGFEDIFKYVYDKFAIRDLGYVSPTRREPSEVNQLWVALFDWNKITALLQNWYFVQLRTTVERAEDYVFGQALTNIALLIAHYGKQGFIDAVIKEIHTLQTSSLPMHRRKIQRFENMLLGENFTFPANVHKDKNGLFVFQ